MVGEGPISNRTPRRRLGRTSKFTAVSVGFGRRKLNSRPFRAGGASLMFEVGCELEIANRRGRWISAPFRLYLRRGEGVVSGIGRGMSSLARNYGRAGWERGRYGSVTGRATYYRLVELSKCMYGAMRRPRLPGMTRKGRAPDATLLKLDGSARRQSTFGGHPCEFRRMAAQTIRVDTYWCGVNVKVVITDG